MRGKEFYDNLLTTTIDAVHEMAASYRKKDLKAFLKKFNQLTLHQKYGFFAVTGMMVGLGDPIAEIDAQLAQDMQQVILGSF